MADDIFEKILNQLKVITKELDDNKGGSGNSTNSGKGSKITNKLMNKLTNGLGKNTKSLVNGYKAISKGMSAVGISGGVAGGALATGTVVAGVALAGAAFVKSVGKLIDYNDELIESFSHLAKVNGQYAYMMAENMVKQMFRDMEFANATSETAKSLSDAQNRLKDSALEWQIAWANLTNTVTTWITDFFTWLIDFIKKYIINTIPGGKYLVPNGENEETWAEQSYYVLLDMFDLMTDEQRDRRKDKEQEKAKENKGIDLNQRLKNFVENNNKRPVQEFGFGMFEGF